MSKIIPDHWVCTKEDCGHVNDDGGMRCIIITSRWASDSLYKPDVGCLNGAKRSDVMNWELIEVKAEDTNNE